MKETPLPIQVEEASPLKPDFKWGAIMLGIVWAIIISLYLFYSFFASLVISLVNIEAEQKYLWPIFATAFSGELLDMSEYKYSLPEDKSYDIYILDDDMENAFASVWGRLMVTQGLLDNVENQEELFFILGHEIEHLENRDPLRALLVHAPISVSLILLWFDAWLPVSKINNMFSNLKSRKAEHMADKWWIELLHRLGANTACAATFFERNGSDTEKYIELFSSHPVSQDRIDFITESAGDFQEKECTEL